MLSLYITRHGETVWNREKKLQGWKDSELTEQGKINAQLLGVRLRNTEFQRVYSSPSERTMTTAKLITGERDYPILQDENLKEINMGDWEGQTHAVLQQQFPGAYYAFWNMPHLYSPRSGESFDQVGERAIAFLKRVKAESKSGNVLIVTHTIFIKALLLHVKKRSLEEFWAPPFIHDTCLTIIEIDEGEYYIKLEGDISHRDIEAES
ncbi:histidine phosphatase family protein [Sutcliffiella deserti]|uniref:histidine phosphatase family protein n=1 Tax=Sutcliffiella deserti TaxID=2875501 RepID=UPI001CBF6DDA|nr:histidine phosphatase family protein [Sutcliffiella deserti]